MKAHLATFIIALALAWTGSGKPRDLPFIYLNSDQTLHFVIIDNIETRFEYSDENERFYHIETVLSDLLAELDFPMPYTIDRFGARPPRNQPYVNVYINKWGNNGLNEIEVRLSAVLHAAQDKNKLGFWRNTDGAFGLPTGRRIEQYNEVLKKALIKLMAELNSRLREGSAEAVGQEAEQ